MSEDTPQPTGPEQAPTSANPLHVRIYDCTAQVSNLMQVYGPRFASAVAHTVLLQNFMAMANGYAARLEANGLMSTPDFVAAGESMVRCATDLTSLFMQAAGITGEQQSEAFQVATELREEGERAVASAEMGGQHV